ncbi:MAG: TilS substrate-binding domain-containing protein, partial [Actinomycetota bacterium]
RQAELLRDEGELLDELAAELDPADVAAMRVAPVALARRALRRWLRTEHPPRAADVERVLRVVAGDHVATEVGGRRIARRGGRLVIQATSAPGPGW